MELGTIVLAGGRASRLGGADKAAIEVGGASLLTLALRAVASVAVPGSIVVVGDGPIPADPIADGVALVREDPPFAGPAAAIGAGLALVTTSHVLIVACDQPGLAEALPALADACARRDGAIAVDPDGRLQYLTVAVDTARLRDAVAMLDSLADVSVRRLLSPLDLVEVPVSRAAVADLDTWDDVHRAQRT